jgi:hypothetical protein
MHAAPRARLESYVSNCFTAVPGLLLFAKAPILRGSAIGIRILADSERVCLMQFVSIGIFLELQLRVAARSHGIHQRGTERLANTR